MNAKGFFLATLTSAIDLGVATGDDILRHVTPAILGANLPRPLWARLLTACVGASGIDAQLVVETIGVANVCEHAPPELLWRCLSDIAAKMMSTDDAAYRPPVTVVALAPEPPAPSTPPPLPAAPAAPVTALLAPSPAAAAPVQTATQAALPMAAPSIPAPAGGPLADLVAELDADERPLPGMARSRTSTSQRFRAGGTGSGIGRPAPTSPAPQPRRPQAAASVIEAGTSRARRTSVDPANDYDIETDVRLSDDWRPVTQPSAEPAAVDVDDEQLVDWAQSEETVTGGDGLGRKR